MKPGTPVFLERQTYRRRRLIDAARLLPVLGLLLFFVPMLATAPEAGGVRTGPGAVYIFGVWAILILAAALIVRRMVFSASGEPIDAPEDAPHR